MINFVTLKESLYDFVSVQSGQTTIWGDQDGTQPDKPYIALRLDPFMRVGQDYFGRPDAAGNNKITGNREFTLEIQAFGTNVMGILEAIRMSVNKPSVREALNANGIVFVDSLAILNLAAIQDTRFLERAAMDLLFRIAQQSTDAPGFVGKTEHEGKYYKDGQLVATETFDVDSTP